MSVLSPTMERNISMTTDDVNGLQWRTRRDGTRVAYWCATARCVKAGYTLKTQRLWAGREPSETERGWISDECARLQCEMLEWSQEGMIPAAFDGTMKALSRRYQTDPDSPFRQLRFATRNAYADDLKIIENTVGERVLSKLSGRDFRRWYQLWRKPKEEGGPERIRRAHGAMVMVRILVNWGVTDDVPHCARLSAILKLQRFSAPVPRKDRLTWQQAEAIVTEALARGCVSIAMAQAMQADCAMRQKDLIGEWVPLADPGISEVIRGSEKWLRGVRWEEINQDLILVHDTSKRDRTVTHDLRACMLVMRVLAVIGDRPASGAMIVNERTNLPYRNKSFYDEWRCIADAVGIPKGIWNMDSRAGAITEGHDAGAEIEALRQTAGHSNISTTARYNRQTPEKSRKVALLRSAFRERGNKQKT